MLRAARIHLEQSNTGVHTGETTVASKHASQEQQGLQIESHHTTDLMSMFDPPSPFTSISSHEVTSSSSSSSSNNLTSQENVILAPLTPTKQGMVTNEVIGGHTPKSLHSFESSPNHNTIDDTSAMVKSEVQVTQEIPSSNNIQPIITASEGETLSNIQTELLDNKAKLNVNVVSPLSSHVSSPPTSPSLIQTNEKENKATTGGGNKTSKKVKSDSPFKRDVKVKSKEGLKSFLATTFKVKEMLTEHISSSSSSFSDEHTTKENQTTMPTTTTEAASSGTVPSKKSQGAEGGTNSLLNKNVLDLMYKLQQITDVLGHGEISGVTRKLQIKGLEWAPICNDDEDDDSITSSDADNNSDVMNRSTRVSSNGDLLSNPPDDQPLRNFGVVGSKSSKLSFKKKGLRFRATKIEIILKWVKKKNAFTLFFHFFHSIWFDFCICFPLKKQLSFPFSTTTPPPSHPYLQYLSFNCSFLLYI